MLHLSASCCSTSQRQEVSSFFSLVWPQNFNMRSANRLRNLEVEYVSGNPLDYVELTAKIDVTR